MTEEQIKYMVNRFLQWKLPEDFNPDGGVKYTPIAYHQTIGTNLLTASQAQEMVEFMIHELPESL